MTSTIWLGFVCFFGTSLWPEKMEIILSPGVGRREGAKEDEAGKWYFLCSVTAAHSHSLPASGGWGGEEHQDGDQGGKGRRRFQVYIQKLIWQWWWSKFWIVVSIGIFWIYEEEYSQCLLFVTGYEFSSKSDIVESAAFTANWMILMAEMINPIVIV